MARYSHSGGAVPTSIVVAMSDVSMDDIIIDSAQGWPDGTDGPFFAVLDRGLSTEEKVLLGSRSSTTITVVQRGADNTLPQPHGAGAKIEHVFTALEAEDANVHIESTDDVHGIPPGQVIATETLVDTRIAEAAPATYDDQEIAAGSPVDDPTLTTTVHGLPYPDVNDGLRVQAALRLLAEALDGKVPIILNGTSTPPEPAGDYPEGTVYFRTEP